jgi:hypothetical protein
MVCPFTAAETVRLCAMAEPVIEALSAPQSSSAARVRFIEMIPFFGGFGLRQQPKKA